MTLTVPFEQFAAEAKARLPKEPVYLRWKHGRLLATAGDPSQPLRLVSVGAVSLSQGEESLRKAGLDVRRGEWGEPDAEEDQPYWLGVVAYRSDEAKPGLWVEAFPTEPTTAFVIETMLEEFRRQGLVGDMNLEQFVAKADLHTMVFSPGKLAELALREAARD